VEWDAVTKEIAETALDRVHFQERYAVEQDEAVMYA
jgi:hypothetical protein